jgi:hypothetical protein
VENIETIVADYVQALTAMDICHARPASALRLALPRWPYGEDAAIRIDMDARAAKHRLEEIACLAA